MRESMECFRLLILYGFLLSSIRIATTTLNTITLEQSIRDGETVVSAAERFELGFFSPGTSRMRYLGIWYKKITPLTTVWVANRNTPISDTSGVLRIDSRGVLVLLNSTNDVVWLSNASRIPENPVAELLTSGNLVVKDGNDNKPENYLWQSFDYPGDTLLPGMTLGINMVTGQEWFLSSWKRADDPSQGDFTLRIDPHGHPQSIVKKGPEIALRTGSWNGYHWNAIPTVRSNSEFSLKLVSNEKEVTYTYKILDSSILVRVVMNESGIPQFYAWTDKIQTWASIYSTWRDECDNYANCSAYATCNINNIPICACLEGFVPKFPREWNAYNWSAGCVRKAALDCEHEDGFLMTEAVKLPDTSYSRAEKYISLVECEKLCLNNCSCTAYATLDIREGGIGCLLWFTDLIDIKDTQGGQDLFVRVAASEIGNSNTKSRRQPRGKKKKNVKIIVTTTISGMGALVLVSILFMWKIKLRNKGKINDNHEMDDNGERSGNDDFGLTIYDLNTIVNATDNFSDTNKLGEGGFGPVYKGMLIEGQEIAVKRLSKCSGQGMEEFKNEVTLIAKLQHRNLVKLLGCCTQRDERILIYEYMPNQSLNYFIFDETRKKLLDWSNRIQIIKGTARGLLYLHQDSRLRIIHRDLKTSNVLLDKDMKPKISDFGMARTFGGDQTEAETNRIAGTYGYMSPEYAVDGIFSMKSDVFSFGVLVLEIVSGRRNKGFYHTDHNHNLLGHQRPEDRPNMSYVVLMLDSEGSLPQPKQPGFFTERNLPQSESSPSNAKNSSTNEITISTLEPR